MYNLIEYSDNYAKTFDKVCVKIKKFVAIL